MTNEKVSVIVPAYNIQDYIERAVESICRQTYQNIEIILVDDGSGDDTPQILDRLSEKDKRIKVFHKTNGGVTSARLYGVRHATGDWIGFVDGDDSVEPQMYEMLLYNAKKYKAEISHCGYQMVFPDHVDLYYGTGRVIRQDTITGLKDLLRGTFIEPGLWNKLFRRELFHRLLDCDLMDLSIKNLEDLLMNYYLFREAKQSVFSDQCYYRYILRKESASTSKNNEHKLLDPVKVLKILKTETIGTPELCNIVEKRIIDRQIRLATWSLKQEEEEVRIYRTAARKELRQSLPEIIKGKYGLKIKIRALWVSVWPESYRWIHTIYEKATGIDKKYKID